MHNLCDCTHQCLLGKNLSSRDGWVFYMLAGSDQFNFLPCPGKITQVAGLWGTSHWSLLSFSSLNLLKKWTIGHTATPTYPRLPISVPKLEKQVSFFWLSCQLYVVAPSWMFVQWERDYHPSEVENNPKTAFDLSSPASASNFASVSIFSLGMGSNLCNGLAAEWISKIILFSTWRCCRTCHRIIIWCHQFRHPNAPWIHLDVNNQFSVDAKGDFIAHHIFFLGSSFELGAWVSTGDQSSPCMMTVKRLHTVYTITSHALWPWAPPNTSLRATTVKYFSRSWVHICIAVFPPKWYNMPACN